MMLKNFIRQAGGPTETLQRILGHVAATAAIVGVTARVLTGFRWHRPAADLQPVDISFVPSCMSAPGAGIQAYCVTHGCLGHWLGSHVQHAPSVRGMDGSPTVLQYQLPWVASSTPGPEPTQRAPSRQGRSDPYGKHCDICVFQPAMRLRSRRMSQLTRHLLPWSQKHLRSLPAIHISEVFNQAANELSRAALPGGWRLHP